MENIYSVGPKRAKEYICKCLEAGLVPMIESMPGIGKSAIVKKIAHDYQLEMIDVRLSMCEPSDLMGLPHFAGGKAEFTPYEIFPVDGDPIPQGMNGFMLFLDEFNSAPRSVVAAAYKIVLDRMVGNSKLHPDCYIVCAGNRMEDKAIVNNIGTAMKSRLVHIHMHPNFNDWLEEVGIPEEYDSRIIAYLNAYPNKLCTFDPDRNEDAFACPRTWQFCNQILKLEPDKEISDDLIPLLGGTIGPELAVEFVQFSKIFNELPSIKSIQEEPRAVPVPKEAARKWAVLTMILEKMDPDKISNITVYINRFDIALRIMFYKSLLIKHKELFSALEVTSAVADIAEYLHEY